MSIHVCCESSHADRAFKDSNEGLMAADMIRGWLLNFPRLCHPHCVKKKSLSREAIGRSERVTAGPAASP